MTDWGVHLLDYALLGMKASLPNSIVAMGGKFAYPNLAEETPDTLTTLYEFDDFNLVWDSAMGIDNGSYGRDHGIAFIGNNATLVLNRGGWEVIEEKNSEQKITKPLVTPEDNGLFRHAENFIDAIRSNDATLLNCSIEQGIANLSNSSPCPFLAHPLQGGTLREELSPSSMSATSTSNIPLGVLLRQNVSNRTDERSSSIGNAAVPDLKPEAEQTNNTREAAFQCLTSRRSRTSGSYTRESSIAPSAAYSYEDTRPNLLCFVVSRAMPKQ